MHVFHRGSAVCASRMDIDWAAGRMVSETASEGPIIRPYRAWSERAAKVPRRKTP